MGTDTFIQFHSNHGKWITFNFFHYVINFGFFKVVQEGSKKVIHIGLVMLPWYTKMQKKTIFKTSKISDGTGIKQRK